MLSKMEKGISELKEHIYRQSGQIMELERVIQKQER